MAGKFCPSFFACGKASQECELDRAAHCTPEASSKVNGSALHVFALELCYHRGPESLKTESTMRNLVAIHEISGGRADEVDQIILGTVESFSARQVLTRGE